MTATGELSGIERRLVMRLEGYWSRLRADQLLPPFADFDPYVMGELWGNCLVAEVAGTAMQRAYNYTYVGEGLIPLLGHNLVGKQLTLGVHNDIASRVFLRLDEAATDYTAVVEEGESLSRSGALVRFRSIAVPFGDGGFTTHLVVGLSWQVI